MKKIEKTTIIFQARVLLVKKKSQELIEKIKRMQKGVSRKRKKVTGKDLQLVRMVLKLLK
jgi:hypothetical protein